MNKLNIIHEDEAILVINKPAAITVNRADTTKNELTVQDQIEDYLKFKVRGESDFYKRAGIVHRIDKETSGILVIAKHEESFINLQSQFKERKIKKTYIALVHGEVSPPQGKISAPVGRLPWNRKRFGVLAGGKESITEYKLILLFELKNKNVNEKLSLLELNPETGRTHQIRVHLKYFNHPIFSDPLYAGRKTSRNDRQMLPRVFLHAKKITFSHPTTNKLIEIESTLPPELNDFLNNL